MVQLQLVEQHMGVRATSRGWLVPAARLSLDGDTRQRVGFVADFDLQRRLLPRVLCSAAVAEGMAGNGTCLTPPWAKPFQLGKLAVALLPAGSSAGAAMLRLHLEGQTLLDARPFAEVAFAGALPAEFREADGVLLDASAAHLTPTWLPELQAWSGALIAVLQGRTRETPLELRVDDALSGAWLVAQALDAVDGLQVELTPSLRKAFGWLAPPRTLPRKRKDPKHFLHVALRSEGELPAGAWLLYDPQRPPSPGLDDSAGEPGPSLAWRRRAVGSQVERAAERCGAKWAILQDESEDYPGATALAERLAQRGVQSWLLRAARQMPLM